MRKTTFKYSLQIQGDIETFLTQFAIKLLHCRRTPGALENDDPVDAPIQFHQFRPPGFHQPGYPAPGHILLDMGDQT